MKFAGSIVAVALGMAVGACAREPAPATSPSAEAQVRSCPLAQLSDVRVAINQIHDGLAVTFMAPAGEVDQVRSAVRSMADANDRYGDAFATCPCGVNSTSLGAAERMPPARGTEGGPSETNGTPDLAPPRATAQVADLVNGAELRLQAQDWTRIDSLRAATREYVQAMRRNCLGETLR
jgi:hypothetical protein